MNARKTASQRSIAELSEVVCIHSLSDSYESEESQGKIDLTLFAVKWNSESTIFITLAHGWIFPFDLIATPQTPPLSGGSTRSDFERLLDLRNLWSALTFFIYLFFLCITQLVECFVNDANTLQSVPRSIFYFFFSSLDSRARKHRRLPGVMNQVACLCSFWCNAFAANAQLELLLVRLYCPLLCRCYQT